MLDVYDIIAKKRDGLTLTRDELFALVDGYTRGSVPEFQMSAFLMAVYFNGMRDTETHALADIMAHSGDMLNLSIYGGLTVDKHSTGGVGDKTTLIVAPICHAAGLTVAKMSGRGLGHTGGTVDKLESIPGFQTDLSRVRFFELLSLHGIVVAGQSGNLAPADKKMYALRDATATVDSIPLIAASIMSKKLAAGAKNIVLDVKTGSGALMKENAQAYDLAHQMVDIAHRAGRNCMAYITDMSRPLGYNVGNALEVVEAVRILQGAELDGDLATLCISLSAGMIHLAKKIPIEEALGTAYDLLESGKAYDSFRKWISVQGGDLHYVDDPARLPLGKHSFELFAEEEGYLGLMDTEKVGMAARALGAGRLVPGAPIDHGAGIVFDKRPGDPVLAGERLCTLYADDEALLELGAERMEALLQIEEEEPEVPELIQDRVTADDLYHWD